MVAAEGDAVPHPLRAQRSRRGSPDGHSQTPPADFARAEAHVPADVIEHCRRPPLHTVQMPEEMWLKEM